MRGPHLGLADIMMCSYGGQRGRKRRAILTKRGADKKVFGFDREGLLELEGVGGVDEGEIEFLNDGSHDEGNFLPGERSANASSCAEAELGKEVRFRREKE